MDELGRRAVACKRWRWLPGMYGLLAATGARKTACVCRVSVGLFPNDNPGWTPDLADAGTLGCLLRLVREAHGHPGAWCEPDGGDLSRWAVYAFGRGRIAYGESEAEALVRALEVAP